MSREKKNGMSSAELSSFCGQVALILEAGFPLYEGMETLAKTDSAGANADMYRSASAGVEQNGSLYETLKADGRWPDYLVEMTGIGERSGRLDQVMRGLEHYYAREERIRSSIVSAVTYPLTLGVMLAAIVLLMLWKVLPVFRRVLDSMGMTGSGSTWMRMGTAVGWLVMILVILAVILILTLLILMRTKHAGRVKEILWRIFPGIRRLNEELSASRVASVLSMMLSGGFRTEEALTRAVAVLDDKTAAAKVEEIRQKMASGKNFADALSETNLFRELDTRMIRMGWTTGREDQVLEKLGNQYEEQAEQDISRMIGIIEPTLVALLCIVIGAVLLSVMLPMAGILSSL